MDCTNLQTRSLDTVSPGVKTAKRPFRKFHFYPFSSRSSRVEVMQEETLVSVCQEHGGGYEGTVHQRRLQDHG